MTDSRPDTRKAALLAEAHLLEEMRGDWDLAHGAAYARCSVSYLIRSDCPKHYRRLNGTKGKLQPYLIPSEVRAWDAGRKVRDGEVAA
jgi:hypothetical protein